MAELLPRAPSSRQGDPQPRRQLHCRQHKTPCGLHGSGSGAAEHVTGTGTGTRTGAPLSCCGGDIPNPSAQRLRAPRSPCSPGLEGLVRMGPARWGGWSPQLPPAPGGREQPLPKARSCAEPGARGLRGGTGRTQHRPALEKSQPALPRRGAPALPGERPLGSGAGPAPPVQPRAPGAARPRRTAALCPAAGPRPASRGAGGVTGPGRNQCKFIKAFICSWYDQEWDSDLLYNLIQ